MRKTEITLAIGLAFGLLIAIVASAAELRRTQDLSAAPEPAAEADRAAIPAAAAVPAGQGCSRVTVSAGSYGVVSATGVTCPRPGDI